MCKQPLITRHEIWRIGRMCQHLPTPTQHQISHIVMVISYCVILEQNDTTHQQFWLYMAKGWPHLILQELNSNGGHWPWYRLAQDCQARVYFGHWTWHAWLLEHPECIMQVSSLVTDCAIQHSLVSAEVQVNASKTHQPLKCNQGMCCLHLQLCICVMAKRTRMTRWSLLSTL